jgi:RimJ/RimL family protein N-acetyltransferase
LVPYEASFVPEYNLCLKNPQLQELTGSEPLSLEEEYEMQRAWQDDESKLCLLILTEGGSFVGDVNAFFRLEEDENGKVCHVAEVSVMVAREEERKKGHASRSLKLLFDLLNKMENRPTKLEARIKTHNEASIALFDKLEFKQESVSEAFGETTMVLFL